MKLLTNSLVLLSILLITSIVLAQDISGIYTNTTDAGPARLILNQDDDAISLELDDGRSTISLTGTIEDDILILDTSEMPFTITSTLDQDTITMLLQGKDDEEEVLELSFKFDSAFATTARAPQDTLSQLLKFVPANQKVHETELFYSNLWALSGFRNAATVQSQNDYIDSQFSEAYYAYLRNLGMFMHLPFDANNVTRLADDMPSTVGFSWFDIQASLSYGSLKIAKFPESGYVAYTTADQGAIKNALQELGFAEENFQDQDIWTLGEDGVLDPERKNPSNPFGGELGLSANVLLAENVIGYAAHKTTIKDQVISYSSGSYSSSSSSSAIDSVTSKAAFRFLVEQLEAEDAVLAQVYFPPVDRFKLSAELLDHFDRYMRGPLKDLFTEISTFKSVLPKYQHVAIAQYFEEEADYNYTSTTISMLYGDVDDAVKARAELFNRLILYYQHLPEITVHPAMLSTDETNFKDESYFVVSVKVEDPNSALEERQSLAEPYNIWVGEIFRDLFMPIYYSE